MDTIDFELLLKKDRNWLSKYGGFISLIIICALLAGIIYIKVPEYRDLSTSDGIAMVEINKNNFIAATGDIIYMSNESAKEYPFIVDSIQMTNEKEIFYFNKQDTSVKDGNFRFVIKERSLLESLMSPFIKH